MSIVIQNGLVVTESRLFKADVLIEGGKISALQERISIGSPADIIDASNKIVFPGIIDVHTHIQWGYLGNSTADNFSIGTGAAARGGVTTIIDFALQGTGSSLLESLNKRRGQIDGQSHIDYSLHLMLTDFNEAALEEIPRTISMGYPSYKLFMTHSSSERIASLEDMTKVSRLVKEHNGILGIHAEKDAIVRRETESLVNQGRKSLSFFPFSRPKIAEVEAIKEAIQVAKEFTSPIYIFHLTTAEGLEKITQAQSEGIPIVAETCPHYLFFTQEVYEREDGRIFLANPPLRETSDREALWRGLKERKLHAVSSDHCAFTVKQKKEADHFFAKGPAGIPGVELLFPLFYTGAQKRGLSLNEIAELSSSNPAKIFGLYPRKGSIQCGADADLLIYDPNVNRRVNEQDLHMGSDYSPYDGFELTGKVERTILRGETIFFNGNLVGNGNGQFIPRFLRPPLLPL
jgi:dihydropyrimidinase